MLLTMTSYLFIATAFEDYLEESSFIRFSSSVQEVTVEIPIIEDAIFEMNEAFSIEIRHPFPEEVDPGLEIVTPSTLVIIDDRNCKLPSRLQPIKYLYVCAANIDCHLHKCSP